MVCGKGTTFAFLYLKSEVFKMSEDTQSTDQGTVVASEPTLDDVIAEYNVNRQQ